MPHRIQNLAAAHEDRAQAGSEQQIARQAGIGGEIMRAALDCAKRQRIDHRTGFKACADLEHSEKASDYSSKSSKFPPSGGLAWQRSRPGCGGSAFTTLAGSWRVKREAGTHGVDLRHGVWETGKEIG